MTSTFKLFVPALIATLAASALLASTASAGGFETETENPQLTVSETPQSLQFGIYKLSCEKEVLNGIELFNTHITATPIFSGCTITIGSNTIPVDFNTSGCDYEFNAGNEMQITCPEGADIDIKATLFGMTLNCLTIHGQVPEGPTVDYLNFGVATTREILVQPTVTGISFTKQGVCGSGTSNSGSYSGALRIKGDNALGQHVGIWWKP